MSRWCAMQDVNNRGFIIERTNTVDRCGVNRIIVAARRKL